jgi:ketopantoate reductase
MPFKSLFMAKAPDADKEKHRSVIDTGKYRLFIVIVQNQQEALDVCREFVEKEKIVSILLCPGFTHTDVAEIIHATDGQVGVSVARSDNPGRKIVHEALQREGFFS